MSCRLNSSTNDASAGKESRGGAVGFADWLDALDGGGAVRDSYGGGSGVQAVSADTLIRHKLLAIANLVRFMVELPLIAPTIREFIA